MDVSKLTDQVRELLADFYNPEEIDIFMDMAHPQMDGKTPNAMIEAGAGASVLQVIRRLTGVYL